MIAAKRHRRGAGKFPVAVAEMESGTHRSGNRVGRKTENLGVSNPYLDAIPGDLARRRVQPVQSPVWAQEIQQNEGSPCYERGVSRELLRVLELQHESVIPFEWDSFVESTSVFKKNRARWSLH